MIEEIVRLATHTRCPISAVSLSAIIDGPADCPPVARVTWSAAPGEVDGVNMTWAQPEPAIWALPNLDINETDATFLSAAWRLGAWDVARTEHAPLPLDANPMEPKWGITASIDRAYIVTGEQYDGAPIDVRRWALEAARRGWITWLAKPMWFGPAIRRKAWLGKDVTLLPDGSRGSRDFGPQHPVWIGTNHQTIIRLGKQ